ncbi:MAG: hypothetical protein LBT35_00005, partial [Tannerella sp.]|nr:hypothetical protein [Tannerella sp.]
WLRFLRDTGLTKPVQEDLKDNEEILKAMNICARGAYTDAELATYEVYWDKVRIEKDLYSDGLYKGLVQGRAEGREEGLEEGIAKGLEKGREEGLEEGIAKGREEGREEGIAKGREEIMAEMIRNGHKAGLSMEQLQALSHYPSEKITEIINKTGQ